MSENHFLGVIRVWAAVAWADDVIADSERTAMERLIKTAPLDDAQRAEAFGWLEHKIELDASEVAGLSRDSRLGVYRAAARLAAVDQDVAVEEKAFLVRLRDALGLDEQEARDLEADIPGHG
jgi:uncharacterized membrane protein YebE (DUF533 family)